MGWALRFFIVKDEGHFQGVPLQSVVDSKRDFARVFQRQDLVSWKREAERAPIRERNFGINELFVPQKAMISAADLLSFVPCPLLFDPMQKIAHDGGMTLPTLLGG